MRTLGKPGLIERIPEAVSSQRPRSLTRLFAYSLGDLQMSYRGWLKTTLFVLVAYAVLNGAVHFRQVLSLNRSTNITADSLIFGGDLGRAGRARRLRNDILDFMERLLKSVHRDRSGGFARLNGRGQSDRGRRDPPEGGAIADHHTALGRPQSNYR